MAIHDLLCVGVSVQDLQKSLSSQGSPSISPAPFGSHVTTSSGADANSPALSQNSAPSSAPNGQSFHPSLGSGSLARQLARPAELDRVSSGYLEPGELLLLKKCCCSKSVAPKVLLLKKCCSKTVAAQRVLLLKTVVAQNVLPCNTTSLPCLLLLAIFCVQPTGNTLSVALARNSASQLLTASKQLCIQALPRHCPWIGSRLDDLLWFWF